MAIAIENFGQAAASQTPVAAQSRCGPDTPTIHRTVGGCLHGLGELPRAISNYRDMLDRDPDNVDLQSKLLYALSIHDACAPSEYLSHAKRYGECVTRRTKPYTRWNALDRHARTRVLRIGLISGDMRVHPVGYFLENTLRHLTRDGLELFAYSTAPAEDVLTERLRPHFAKWKTVAESSDESLARQIHDDDICILIDLAGHTANNRLPVFAWRPAPVQASWLGYWASTGVPAIDYLLTDPVSSPTDQRRHFTETLWYLPHTRLCFTEPGHEGACPVAPTPAVRNGYVTFGSFQNIVKLTDDVLRVWARIFEKAPNVRLRLQSDYLSDDFGRQTLLARLDNAGIDRAQVILSGFMPRDSYLAAHSEVDIILDTFPYTGGTTTCEALWMGVPTLTICGDTLLSRQCASMLACAGLSKWIANDRDDYVIKALAHSADVENLVHLRSGLRKMATASPLLDGERFARDLELALLGMWQHKFRSAAVDSTYHTSRHGNLKTPIE
jgi:protein O-GlcNAc transferase